MENNIGNSIREIRKKKGYSLQKIAREANVSVCYLVNLEMGNIINPQNDYIEKICRVLNVISEDLNKSKIDIKVKKRIGNKTSITKLVLIYKDDDLMLDFLKETLDGFSKYVDIINQQENITIVDKYRLSKEDLMERIKILDMHRRMVHNIIITGVQRINLLCRENNIDIFYDGDENDRVQIAEFAMRVVEETFNNRKK